MGIAPVAFVPRLVTIGLLIKKVLEEDVPDLQSGHELPGMIVTELQCQSPQAAGSCRLRPPRDVALDGLNLMELAILHQNVRILCLQHLDHSRLAVDDESGDLVADAVQGSDRPAVIAHTLLPGIQPEKVPTAGTTQQDAILLVDTGDVHGDDDPVWLRRAFPGHDRQSIKALLQGAWRDTEISRQIPQGLLAFGVLGVDSPEPVCVFAV